MWQLIGVGGLLSAVILLYINGRLRMMQKYEKRQLLKYEKQVDFFYMQSREREAAFKEMDRFRHNFKNHLICLQKYVEQDNLEAVRDKIREYVNILLLDFKGEYYENKSGNLVVDAVIGYEIKRMKSDAIDFETKLSIPERLPFEATDLCVLLGNILDNAVEAAGKMPEGQRKIVLQMEYQPGRLFILLKNTYTGDLQVSRKGKLLTTKQQKQGHGLGVLSVGQIAQAYQGITTIEQQDGWFEHRILLYENQR